MNRRCELCNSFMSYVEDGRGDYWRCPKCGSSADASYEDMLKSFDKRG